MEKTPEEIEAAYAVARRLANSIVKRVRSSHDHYLDYDDFVQEGMVAWLEGRSMYHAMLRAFGKAAKMSYYSYKVKGMEEPRTITIDELMDSPSTGLELIEQLDRKVDAQKILRRILSIKDERAQFAVLAHFYFGMTLRELGIVFEKSHEWVRTYLIEPELKKLREEFSC